MAKKINDGSFLFDGLEDDIANALSKKYDEGIAKANKTIKEQQLKLKNVETVIEQVKVANADKVANDVIEQMKDAISGKPVRIKKPVKVEAEAELEVALPKDFSVINKGKSKYASRLAEQIKAAYQTSKKDNTDGSNQRLVAYYSAAMEKERLIAEPKKFNLEKQFEFSKDEFLEIQNIYDELISKNETLKKVAELAAEAMREQVKLELSSSVMSQNQSSVLSGNQTEVLSGSDTVDTKIEQWKEYNDLVAIGYDRIQKMKKISESGTVGNNSVYDLLRLNHDAWDEVKANNFFNTIPEEGLKRYEKILEVVEKIVKQMLEAKGLTEEQVVKQLKDIQSAQGGNFKQNGYDSGWSHFATYTNDAKDKMYKENGLTYKVYAAFENIEDLNKDIVSSIMDALTKAGFKGRLKTTTGSTSLADKLNGLAITDQMVVHGSTKNDQEIAYNVLKKLGLNLSYLGGGIDTPDGSFSQTLQSGAIEKYVKVLNQESQAAEQTAKSQQELANARKEATATVPEGNQTPLSSEAKMADVAEEAAKEIEVADEKIEASNEEVEKSEEELEQTTVESRQKSSSAAKKEADEKISQNERVIASNKEVVQSEQNSHDAVDNGVTKALNHLISTETTYQKLIAKKELTSLTPTEASNLAQLTVARERDNEVIRQANSLTNEQIKLQEKYNQKVADVKIGSSAYQGALVNDKLSSYDTFYSRIDANKRNLTPVVEYKNKLDELKTTIKELQAYGGKDGILNITSDEDIAKIAKTISLIETLEQEIRLMQNNVKYQGADLEEALTKMSKISQTLEKNTKMPKSLKEMFEALRQDYEIAIKTGASQQRLEELNAEFARLNANLQASGRTGNSFFNLVGKKINGMAAQFFATYVSLQDLLQLARRGFDTIKEYDTALTEMNKVSKESLSTLKEFQEESFELADAIGATASSIQNSTADWLRLGESLQEAAESAQATNILFNVSEFDSIDEATDSLVSMSQAYKELEKMDIVDIMNNIGNNFSISTDGLARALQNSASSLTTAGNDINEAVALITAGNAIAQDPDSVGAGLRTISLRLVGTKEAKAELEALGEDTEGLITTTSKLRDTILSTTRAASEDGKGFDILDDNGNYKSTYEIMLGLSNLYDDIVAKDKELGTNNLNLLLETIAGKNRSNIAASILQNSELLESVYESSLDSEGSALRENEAYLESIQGHLNQLSNTWDSLWVGENNREVINFFIDLAKSVLETVDAMGGLKTVLLGGGGIFAGFKLFKSGGRAKSCPSSEYATGEFSSDVYELCVA